MANKAILKISCGNLTGFLYPERFGPAGKSVCIKLDKKENSTWMTPIEFEKLAGKGTQHNWKRTVRSVTHDNKMMYHLIEDKFLKICEDRHCKCSPCTISREGPSTTSTTPKEKPSTTSTIPKEKDDKRDIDSDSGISVEISNNAPSTPVIREPITTKEQEAPLPNYTVMIQEAILALTTGGEGCSLLGIFLYILNHYPMMEPVSVMNIKIRSTILMLKRVGIVENVGEEEPDELESVANESKDQTMSDKEVQIVKETEPKSKKPKEVKKATTKDVKKPTSKDVKKPTTKNVKKPTAKDVKKPSSTKKVLLKKKINGKVNSKKKSLGKENSSSNRAPYPTFQNQIQKKLTPSLAAICGKTQMGRNEAVKAIWLYIKKHKLQDTKQKTVINCDDKLKAVTKKKRIMITEVLVYLTKHMTAIN